MIYCVPIVYPLDAAVISLLGCGPGLLLLLAEVLAYPVCAKLGSVFLKAVGVDRPLFSLAVVLCER